MRNLWMAAGLAAAMLAWAQGPTQWVYSGDETTNPFAELLTHGDLIYGVGDDGLIAVTEDGVLWTRRDSRTLADLEGIFHGGGQFVAFGDSGVVVTSPDGVAWTRRQKAGTARLTQGVYGNGTYVLFNSLDDLYHSKDGASWTKQEVREASYLSDIGFGGGRFLAASSYSGTVLASEDGATWTAHTKPSIPNITSVLWAETTFVATTTGTSLALSKDGSEWTLIPGPARKIGRMARSDGRYLGAGAMGQVFASTDARTWTSVETPTTEGLYTVASLKGAMVASGYELVMSPDGKTWTRRDVGSGFRLWGVAHGKGRFVAVGEWSATFLSGNGGLWVSAARPANGFFNQAIHAQDQFVAVGNSGNFATSPDGDTWTTDSLATSHDLRDIVHGSSGYVAVGSNYPFPTTSSIWGSEDGKTWKALVESMPAVINKLAFGNGKYVAVGYGRVLAGNGTEWVNQAVPGSPKDLLSVTFGGGLFVAVGRGGAILTSPDGMAWTDRSTDAKADLRSVTHNGRQFVAIGSPNVLRLSTDGVTWSNGTAPVNVGTSIFHGGGHHIMPIGDGTCFSADAVIASGIRGPGLDGPGGAGSRLHAVFRGGSLHLALPDGFRPASTRVRIRGLQGALVADRAYPVRPGAGIALPNLAPGLYTLQVQDGPAASAAMLRYLP